MDERKDGVAPHVDGRPRRAASELEHDADSIRVDLEDLVGELNRRRRRARKPLLIGATAAGLAGLGLGAFVYARRRARRRRPRALFAALRRAAAHPERVAPQRQEPSLARKILAAAAASAASVIARRAARRVFAMAIPTSTKAEGQRTR
jgi:hypothetical protein